MMKAYFPGIIRALLLVNRRLHDTVLHIMSEYRLPYNDWSFLVQGKDFYPSDERISGDFLVLTRVNHLDVGVYKCWGYSGGWAHIQLAGELHLSVSCEYR